MLLARSASNASCSAYIIFFSFFSLLYAPFAPFFYLFLRQIYKTTLQTSILERDDDDTTGTGGAGAFSTLRRFKGIEGDASCRGELFGSENILQYCDGSILQNLREQYELEDVSNVCNPYVANNAYSSSSSSSSSSSELKIESKVKRDQEIPTVPTVHTLSPSSPFLPEHVSSKLTQIMPIDGEEVMDEIEQARKKKASNEKIKTEKIQLQNKRKSVVDGNDHDTNAGTELSATKAVTDTDTAPGKEESTKKKISLYKPNYLSSNCTLPTK